MNNVDPTPEELDALLENNPWAIAMGVTPMEKPEETTPDDAYHIPGFMVLTCGEDRRPVVFSCLHVITINPIHPQSQPAQNEYNRTVVTLSNDTEQGDGTWYVNQEFTEVLMLLKLATQ